VSPQDGATVRFEWGPTGAERLASESAVAVVVDVLTFTTSVSVAVDRGMAVHPYQWDDRSAEQYAEAHGAVLAGRRGDPATVSLSPVSILEAQPVEQLVLPSPNGSTIAHRLAAGGSAVVAAGLRNRRAVTRWVAGQVGGPIVVIAAGERWPDGTLRPAVEDLWGAGSVIAALAALGTRRLSPEAGAAAAAFRAVEDLPSALLACTSGVELAGRGFAQDVRIAAELDVSDTVPLLRGGMFIAAPDQEDA